MELSRGRHPEDSPLKSTLSEVKGFKGHNTWLDFKDWIDERIDLLKNELVRCEEIEDVNKLQGAILELNFLKQLPDMFIEQIEIEMKEQR